MAYLTIRAMLPRDAECPLCRERLIPDSVYFAKGVAICRTCYTSTPFDLMDATIRSACRPELRDNWATANGLSFFTPKITTPKAVAAHLLGELHDHPHDDELVTG